MNGVAVGDGQEVLLLNWRIKAVITWIGIAVGIRGDKDENKELYVGEGYVTNEVADDLAKIGWKWKEYEDQGI